jgi:hypothetical protein
MKQERKKRKTTKKKTKTVRAWVPRPELIEIANLLVNPDDRRSKADKIKAAGLTEQVFYRWMKDPRFISYLNNLIDKYTDAELPVVWKALMRKCAIGDVSAIKLYFDLKRLNPEFALKQELGKERLAIERQKIALLESKLNGGAPAEEDDGFIDALKVSAANIWNEPGESSE